MAASMSWRLRASARAVRTSRLLRWVADVGMVRSFVVAARASISGQQGPRGRRQPPGLRRRSGRVGHGPRDIEPSGVSGKGRLVGEAREPDERFFALTD